MIERGASWRPKAAPLRLCGYRPLTPAHLASDRSLAWLVRGRWHEPCAGRSRTSTARESPPKLRPLWLTRFCRMSSKASHAVGWIGLGRMGEAMAARLIKAGHGLSVWNRTASKADSLAAIGAEVVTDKAAMAHCATVFTMVSTTDDLKDVLFGADGVLSGNAQPKRVVDMSSISDGGSAEIRKGLDHVGVGYLSAPVSGNAKVGKAGKLLVVASGPKAEYDAVQPLLAALGRSAMYVGEGER